MTATVTAALAPLRARKGQRRTPGLDDATLERLAAGHPELRAAIDAAAAEFAHELQLFNLPRLAWVIAPDF